VLQSALNVVPYSTTACLAVRLHAISSAGLAVGQSLVLAGYGTDPSPDDRAEFTNYRIIPECHAGHGRELVRGRAECGFGASSGLMCRVIIEERALDGSLRGLE